MQHMYPGEKNYDFHTVRLTRMSKGRIDCVQSFCVRARNGSTGEDELIVSLIFPSSANDSQCAPKILIPYTPTVCKMSKI